ncbi:DMT family transporter [Tabrizicola aquatica]|uniref:DMT family transporter n=1 Tax=Tabrizicola aquatica TaxID=909926 RepID=UPI000CD1D09C|nr:DMT family transporter [Tabrizicola aquatica]
MLAVALSLAAAATFALSAMQIDSLTGRVGPLQLARWQMGLAFAMTAAASVVLGGWRTVGLEQFLWLAASSAAGIMLATSTFVATIQLLGPRLNALVFTLSAPFALVLGYAFRAETVNPMQGAGVGLILAGIVLAILGPGGRESGRQGALGLGLALGVVTALGQAAGSLFARPAMLDGVEPFTAMAIRSGLGAAFFIGLLAVPRLRPAARPAPADLRRIGATAFSGIFLGMSLLMAALAVGDVGIVTTLSSTTPILILPMVWYVSRRPPTALAWAGAGLAVAGTALITLAAG